MEPATAGLVALLLALVALARYAERRASEQRMGELVDTTDWRWPRSERTATVRSVDGAYDSLARRRSA